MKKRLVSCIAVLLAMILVMTACSSEVEFTPAKPDGMDTGSKATATPAPTKEPTVTPAEVENTPETDDTPETGDVTEPVPGTADEKAPTTLKEAYKDYFLIGTIYNPWLENDPDRSLILENFNIITPENLMKPEEMQKKRGEFKYSAADQMIKFAKENDLLVHGHTLAWHSQSGNWLGRSAKDRDEAIEQLREHINGVAGHYEGDCFSWDVVNEAISDSAVLPADGDWTKCLRPTQWTASIGTDYIEIAFRLAHEAAPSAKLYYNDYNLDIPAKAQICAAMVADLKAKGVPIDGIGMQGHYNIGTSISDVKSSLDLFTAIDGISISVSELDINVTNIPSGKLTEEMEEYQAVMYAKLFMLYRQYSDRIERITFWGYRDDTSWRSEGCPLLFDKDLNPKKAFYAVLNPEEYAGAELVLPEKKTKECDAAYGTPVIDGETDDCWSSVKAYDIDIPVLAWEGAKGTTQLMWDENNIYALIRVTDPVLNNSASNKYEQDSIEFFLDPNNCKNAGYDKLCGQYRCSYTGELSFGTVPSQSAFTAIAKITDYGYDVELAIALDKTLSAGDKLGFDAQVNDATDTGNRQSVMKLNAISDSDYTNPSAWATAILVK